MLWAIIANIVLFTIVSLFYFFKIRKLNLLLESEKVKGELSSKKEFFETLINAVADPIFVKNSEHQWIYGNEAFSDLLSLKLKDYIGKSDYDLFPKDQADVFWAKDNETLKNLKMVENEELILVKNELRTIVTKKTPVTGIDGGTFLIGVIRDITVRKRQEETIANLYKLIESSNDLYVLCEIEGKPTFVNKHGSDMGIDISIKSWRSFFPKDFNFTVIEEKIKKDHSWSGEVFLINLRTQESVPYWLKMFHILDEKKVPKTLSLVATNIKDRKESELAMYISSKMASLGEMAGGIAHEINNPLSIISGKAEQMKRLLARDDIDRKVLISSVEKIEDTSFRISKIIKGLLSFSHSGPRDPNKETSLTDLIEEALDLCRQRLKSEKIDLRLELENDLKVTFRPTQIQQVIINLLNNSLDAIKDAPDKWISISSKRKENQTIITITDSGTGIPPGLREKMMDPFFTTKDVGAGAGLGLSISKRIMDAHNGELVYNENSPNTSFSLIFNDL